MKTLLNNKTHVPISNDSRALNKNKRRDWGLSITLFFIQTPPPPPIQKEILPLRNQSNPSVILYV